LIFSVSSKKIPVSQSQSLLATNPFASLAMENLPPGEDAPSAASKRVEKKKPRVVLRKEKSQRGGKTVIVVGDIPTHLSPIEIENLARRVKQSCGCGGTVAGREIELQGHDPMRIRRVFENEGFRVDGI
jgi:translation initiation factor 1